MAPAYQDSAIEDRLKKIRGDTYQAQAVPDKLPEYEYARNKALSSVNQANSTAQDALKRRFAAMGALNSGEAIKQQQMQEDAASQARGEALEGISAQEAQAKRALMQQEQERAFQSSEAAKQRMFGAQESSLGRLFQGGESEQARALQREQMSQQQKMFDSDLEFKKWATELQNETALKQISVDMYNSAYNAAINAYDTSDDATVDEYLNRFLSAAESREYYRKK